MDQTLVIAAFVLVIVLIIHYDVCGCRQAEGFLSSPVSLSAQTQLPVGYVAGRMFNSKISANQACLIAYRDVNFQGESRIITPDNANMYSFTPESGEIMLYFSRGNMVFTNSFIVQPNTKVLFNKAEYANMKINTHLVVTLDGPVANVKDLLNTETLRNFVAPSGLNTRPDEYYNLSMYVLSTPAHGDLQINQYGGRGLYQLFTEPNFQGDSIVIPASHNIPIAYVPTGCPRSVNTIWKSIKFDRGFKEEYLRLAYKDVPSESIDKYPSIENILLQLSRNPDGTQISVPDLTQNPSYTWHVDRVAQLANENCNAPIAIVMESPIFG